MLRFTPFLLLVCLLISGLSTFAAAESDAAAPTPLDPEKEYSILFIGNSYTEFNAMPKKLFAAIARAGGYSKVNITALTMGGWYLEQFADAEDSMGMYVDATLKKKKFDYVVIQEQSECPAADPARFYDGARALVQKIRANGAVPVLYNTWGRESGSDPLTQRGWTNESMTWKLAAAGHAIGEELDMDVAYVGLAFYDVYTHHKETINLYNADLTHPSEHGSYLAALTLYATIFQADPAGIEIAIPISEETNAILQQAARAAVFDTPAIPQTYQTVSTGVTHRAAE